MPRSALAFALAAALLLVLPARAADPPQAWLVLSDLHFDPFAQPHLVDRLLAAPPDRWRAIFESSPSAPSTTGNDTNDALLESLLDGARNAAPDPRVVIVAGDFLAGDFRAKFERAVKTHDDAAYRAFVDKTMAFLAWELQAAFPRAHFIPVVGSDDGYCGSNASTPHDAFLARTAAVWAASVGARDPNAFIAQFSTGGYYSVPLPIDGAQAIVLNDVFWSAKYKNTCGDATADPGGDELSWLQATQAAIPAGTPVWMIASIPPGIDVRATLHAVPASSPVPFLADRYNDAFITALDSRSTVVMAIAGHAHAQGFRAVGPDPSTPRAPMLVVPAVSPRDGDAPAFTVLDVDPVTAQVDDARIFSLKGKTDWRRAFDFATVYGRGTIDAAHLWGVQQLLFDNERARGITDSTWRAYWCANVALTETDYSACAMPQIQRDLPPHPSPPPSPSPSPSPEPSAGT